MLPYTMCSTNVTSRDYQRPPQLPTDAGLRSEAAGGAHKRDDLGRPGLIWFGGAWRAVRGSFAKAAGRARRVEIRGFSPFKLQESLGAPRGRLTGVVEV